MYGQQVDEMLRACVLHWHLHHLLSIFHQVGDSVESHDVEALRSEDLVYVGLLVKSGTGSAETVELGANEAAHCCKLSTEFVELLIKGLVLNGTSQ